MSMLINAISAAGNNSGITPLLIRDCGIEVPTKVVQTYNQNKKESPVVAKHAVRERSLDEYTTTAVWVGGVPLVEYGFNKVLSKKGLNGNISYNLLENNGKKDTLQSIDLNIKKFKKLAPKEVSELEAINKNKGLFKKFTVAKYATALAVPIALMGVVIPKLNFALTSFLMDRDAKKGLLPTKYLKSNKEKNNKSLNIMSTENDTAKNYNKLYNSSSNTEFTALNSIKTKPSFKGF